MSCEKLQVRCPTCGVLAEPEMFLSGTATQTLKDYVTTVVLAFHNHDAHGVKAKEKPIDGC